jgi:hypothetical protein
MSCSIYDKSLFASMGSAPVIKTDKIVDLIEDFDNSISGLWLPLVKGVGENPVFGELLASAGLENNSKFNPCSCDNSQFRNTEGDKASVAGTVTIDDILNSQENIMGDLGECSYCQSTCTDGSPCDMSEDEDNPDKQFCDVRFNVDDYVPKIPYVHQGYISGFSDFKHLRRFPSCSNGGLGIGSFISFKPSDTDFVDSADGRIMIDWVLKESIGEIPYDGTSSRHVSEYVHNKAYTKSLKNKTAGNFIDKDSILNDDLPEIKDFTKPYGFANQTYDNIFLGKTKVGSHWRWNYQSGIMGWYRHFDRNRYQDKRPIKGIDLFIPSGDIFYAKNVGPEISQEQSSTNCPSGLKLVDGTQYGGIISHNTNFVYISENIYPKFIEARERVGAVISDKDEILSKSVLLATHPEYDNIITDLYSQAVLEDRNTVVGQLSTLNQFMTSGTDFKSAGNIYYCQTKEDLIKTLVHKYGCYHWIPPNTDAKLTFKKEEVKANSSYYIDMSFDMVIPIGDTIFNLTETSDTSFKFLPTAPNYQKEFVYNQYMTIGNTNILNTKHNAYKAFDETCSISEEDVVKWEKHDYINISTVTSLNTGGALSNNSGQYSFTDMYQAGRLQHDRIYPASAFNPHVDLLAIHPQGGSYINALPFGLLQETGFGNKSSSSPGGKVAVEFRTKDCGIKIYDVKIKNLQSKLKTSKSCERFPYSQETKCKCYGFSWPGKFNKDFKNNSEAKTWYGGGNYVPNLSTKNSPRLEKYGGYKQAYLNLLFGDNQVVTKPTPDKIEHVDYYIDPLTPWGAESQASVTLPNYVNTTWTLNTKNIATSTHMDLIVDVSENVSLTANRFAGDPSAEDYTSNHNMAWKRFTTKATIGGKTIYDKQANQVTVANNGSLTVKLSNPYLARLINDSTNAYAAPDNSINLRDPTPKLYSTRGDESSLVTLTFTKKPRKNLLNFKIPPPTPYGTLTKSFFDPHIGLTSEKLKKSPFINNRIYTDYTFNGGTTAGLEDNKGIYYATIKENMKKLCHQVSDFNFNRKLRTYVKMGSAWYELETQKRGSYTIDDKQYLGRPRLFEYIKNSKNSQHIPMLFPASPRKLNPWSFFLNHARIDNQSVSAGIQSTYPWLNGKDFAINREFITMGGSRYYFTVEEKFTIVDLEIDSIYQVTSGIDQTLDSGQLVKAGSKYYLYNNGPSNKIDSYLFLGDRYEEILGSPSSLEIEYDKDIAPTNYVYNSLKDCDHKITVFINNNGVITPISERYKIIAKQLKVQGYNDRGRPTISNPVKYRLKTVFKLNQSLETIKKKIFAIDVPNRMESTSLCAFSSNDNSDFSKILRIDQYSSDPRTGKWSDVIGLQDPDRMTELIVDDLEVKDIYPESPYNNWFYKQIINNFEKRCNFELLIRQGGLLKRVFYPNIKATYCILQRYNIEDAEIVDLKNAFLYYQNFIPMIDITLHGKDAQQFYAPGRDLTNLGVPIEGLIYSPNWTRNLLDHEFVIKPPDINTAVHGQQQERFWTEITSDDKIKAAYVPTSTVYSDTLRIDDPTFWLDKTTTKTTRNTEGVRTTFTPSAPTMGSAGLSLPGFSQEIKRRDYAFSIHNIYGDGDEFEECGAQDFSSCFMSTRGSVSLHAHLKIATPTTTSNLSDAVTFYNTYDAGLYNPLGQRNLITISRSELYSDNPLDSAYDHCSTSYLRPDYRRTIIDPERNQTIKDTLVIPDNTSSVGKLDKYANEMLFRIMYGDKGDPVNRAILLSKKKPLNVSDLVNFTDPKVTAADVYDEILYNYDTNASCGDFINNSFSVTGPMKVGDYYEFNIGNKNIYLSVEDYGGGDIRAVGRIGGTTFNTRLTSTASVKTGVTVTDIDTYLDNTENTTYTLKKTSSGTTSKYYGSVAGRIYTGQYAITVRDYGIVKRYGKCLGQHVNDIGYHGTVVPSNSSVSNVGVSNGGTAFTEWQGGAKANIRWGTGGGGSSTCPDRSCDDYEIGYCKRKSGCNTDACDGEEDMENFLYTFKQCRTTFNVYGHKYKILTAVEEEEEEEEDDTVDGDGTGDSGGGGTSTSVSLNCPQDAGKGVRGASSTIAGSCTFHTKNGCSSWGAIYASRRRCDELDAQFAAQYGEHPTSRGAHAPHNAYQQYQRDTGMRGTSADYAGESPLTGDPGYDVCGFSSQSVSIPPRIYWTYKTIGSISDYDGRCPRHVCTISYTNNSISISVGDETTCIEQNITKCPELEAILPAHAYISAENIGSANNGGSDNALQINLPPQKQTFQTLTYTHKEYLGGMSGADVNPVGAVTTATSYRCGLFTTFSFVSSAAYAACGGETWWHANIDDARGTFGLALAAWKARMSEAFSNIDSEIGAEFSWHPKGPPAAAGDGGAERARHKCNANNHISSSDIVQGIIPGTCSDLLFETTSKSYPKYGYDGAGTTSSTATLYTVRAYITYSYKRPVTVQDKLKGWSADSDSYACAQEGKSGQDDYPEWYAQSLGLETRDTLGYPIQNYGGSYNYVRRKVKVSKSTSCGEDLTSYTPEDYYKEGNAKYPYGGAPCGKNDYLCWSKNRDWIRVWKDHSYG